MNFLLVGLGGFLGATVRYGVSLLFTTSSFPWATLIVNVLGCAGIGWLSYNRSLFPQPWILFLIPGVLGGFTTFSAFGFETVRLFQNEEWLLAVLNILSNLVFGLSAIFLVSKNF